MRPIRLATLVAIVSLVAGCSSSASQPAKAFNATLTEFKIQADATKLAAGDVTFTVTNKGSTTHEFVVLRTDLSSDALPKNGDGDVEEEGEGMEVVDEAEDIPPGGSATLTMALQPGKYAFLCNLPGHFAGGMRGTFEVVAST